ncbi:pseudaminic acid cytidylyltransferase [Pelagibacteraceae bacterium]|nr:pseudaminic acid cytidylyltransferase [Pelagibacteraceae bacterium]
MNLAIIPARGNSKRIPQKNIKKFNGLPIIAWTLMIVVKSNIFDKIIVSTDDKNIAKIAKRYKAEVPFFRPKNLSNDHVGTRPVIIHAIKQMQSFEYRPTNVCCIYPTSANISTDYLKKGLLKLKSNKFNYVFSAHKNNSNILRSFIKKKKNLKMLFPNNYKKRVQDLDSVYNDAGQFYWAKTETWLKKENIFSGNSSLVEIPRHKTVDIDTIEDWKLAEKIHIMNRNEKK